MHNAQDELNQISQLHYSQVRKETEKLVQVTAVTQIYGIKI